MPPEGVIVAQHLFAENTHCVALVHFFVLVEIVRSTECFKTDWTVSSSFVHCQVQVARSLMRKLFLALAAHIFTATFCYTSSSSLRCL